MKFALVGNQRKEATPKTKGICPVCNTSVIAKCGDIKAHHWAHETKQNCKNDRWETEGQWHRNWKNKFPIEWLEKIVHINNEKNVADIKTPNNLVLEFQHSHITPEEQKAREKAYDSMIRIVDGTRLKYDFSRFKKKIKEYSSPFKLDKLKWKLYSVEFYDEVFPKTWLNSSVPVAFDFLGLEDEKTADKIQKFLYFLFPMSKINHDEWSIFLLCIPRNDFIPFIMEDKWNNFYLTLLADIKSILDKAKEERDK